MQNLNCSQVIALLTFFTDQKLNPKLMESIEQHLQECPSCREKYLNLQKILTNYQEIKNKILIEDDYPAQSFRDKQYKVFKENLSAYIDNELTDSENLRIKKIAIANSEARQELEDIISFRELLRDSFNKTKNNFKTDLSELILTDLCKSEKTSYIDSYIFKVMPVLTTIISLIVITLTCVLFNS